MAEGNKHLGYKAALNEIELESPGSKHDFYFGFLARASARFVPEAEAEQETLHPCPTCGAPTTGDECVAFGSDFADTVTSFQIPLTFAWGRQDYGAGGFATPRTG